MAGEPLETGTDTLLAEVRDGVGIITFNRPDRRNALAEAMYPAFEATLARFAEDTAVGCVLVTGAGSAFCAGGDVREGSAGQAAQEQRPSVSQRVSSLEQNATAVARGLHEHPKVTIAALPGAAVGAGMAIALACDLRIASERAKLIAGWGRLALSGDFGGAWFLTQLVGYSKAVEILVDNPTIEAPQGLELGLLNRVEPDEKWWDAALEWAGRIASGPTVALGYMKANARNGMRLDLADAIHMESLHQAASSRSRDHGEAVKAWLDKRDPSFEGR